MQILPNCARYQSDVKHVRVRKQLDKMTQLNVSPKRTIVSRKALNN